MGLRGERHGSRGRLRQAPRRFAGGEAQTWPWRGHISQHALPKGASRWPEPEHGHCRHDLSVGTHPCSQQEKKPGLASGLEVCRSQASATTARPCSLRMERGGLERHDDVDVGGRGAEATATVREADCGRAGQRQGKARQDRGAEQSREQRRAEASKRSVKRQQCAG
jgi:hypothetical protein